MKEKEDFPRSLEEILNIVRESLPEKYKTAFLLRDIEEMPYDEVARVLSVPLGTVKSRVNRARSILRDKLKPRLEDRNALSKGALLPVNLF